MKIKIKAVIIAMITPVALDVIAIILALHGMAGGSYSERFISFVFQSANWPSILFKLSPFDQKEPAMSDCINPRVLIFNVVGWGLIGLIVGLAFGKKRTETMKS
jgi:hypothetical protein